MALHCNASLQAKNSMKREKGFVPRELQAASSNDFTFRN